MSSKRSTTPRQPKAYKGSITISYWWRCADFPKGIPANLAEALDETAQARAFEMIVKDYLSGELLDYVNMSIEGVKTPEDGFECRGWWDVKTS